MKPLLFMLKINFKKKTTLNYRTGRAPTSTEALDRSMILVYWTQKKCVNWARCNWEASELGRLRWEGQVLKISPGYSANFLPTGATQ